MSFDVLLIYILCYVPTDMKIFGLCPERDPFTVIVCETCKLCLKPQALFHHFGNYIFIFLFDRKKCACL